jgi:hypothetical protein
MYGLIIATDDRCSHDDLKGSKVHVQEAVDPWEQRPRYCHEIDGETHVADKHTPRCTISPGRHPLSAFFMAVGPSKENRRFGETQGQPSV